MKRKVLGNVLELFFFCLRLDLSELSRGVEFLRKKDFYLFKGCGTCLF
jgi:hypothetical protein